MDREDYLRVTDVLAPISGIDRVPKNILEMAAARGTLVHSIVQWHLAEGNALWDTPGINEEVRGYIQSFENIWSMFGHGLITPFIMEKRFYCDELRLTGQVDLLCTDANGTRWLIDFKTSSKPSPTWPLQMSAYRYLIGLSSVAIDKMAVIHLHKDGSPAGLLEYEDHFQLFMDCYKVYKHFFSKTKGVPAYEVE
jgi:PD-(D/E)XK nuclease superfamily